MDFFDSSFVAAVAARWNQAPVVFRDVLETPLFVAGDFMDGLVGAARAFLQDMRAVPDGRLYLRGKPVTQEQIFPFLPTPDRPTFRDYESQVRAAFPEDDFCIIVDRCERYLPSFRSKISPVLHGIFAEVGYPVRPNHACIYAGNYRSTPFGIHMDDCHVLMLCGVGTKRMAFWPREYFERRGELISMDNKAQVIASAADHLSNATVLEFGPRDVIYWPAAYWHVGLNHTDEFSAALSLGIYHRGTLLDPLAEIEWPVRKKPNSGLAQFDELNLDGYRLTGASPFRDPVAAQEHTAAVRTKLEALRDLLNRPDEAEFRVLEAMLRAKTSAGFEGGATAFQVDADLRLEDAIVRCDLPAALEFVRARDGLLIGANGLTFWCSEGHRKIEEVIRVLKLGGPVSVRGALDSTDASTRAALTSAVSKLLAAGAISRMLAP